MPERLWTSSRESGETTNVDETVPQADGRARMARGERSREVLRGLIIGALPGTEANIAVAKVMTVDS